MTCNEHPSMINLSRKLPLATTRYPVRESCHDRTGVTAAMRTASPSRPAPVFQLTMRQRTLATHCDCRTPVRESGHDQHVRPAEPMRRIASPGRSVPGWPVSGHCRTPVRESRHDQHCDLPSRCGRSRRRAGPGRAGRFRSTVVPLCESHAMTSTVTSRADADRVAEQVAAGLSQLADARVLEVPRRRPAGHRPRHRTPRPAGATPSRSPSPARSTWPGWPRPTANPPPPPCSATP